MITFAATLLALTPQAEPTGRPAEIFRSEQLENGVRVHAVQFEDATRVAVFTFLPVGLGDDPLGRAQFSHLAEHMLIRSTDPERLMVGQIMLNGETMARTMRLEGFGPPADWQKLVERHPKWLLARQFDAASLEREKVQIEAEERNTVPRGFNSKWATAAWAQVRAGSMHVGIHADVATATVAEITEFIEQHIHLEHAQIFVAGPTPTDEVIAFVRKTFEEAKPTTAAKPAASRPTSKPSVEPFTQPGHREVTWDFDATQYIEWYPLPATCQPLEAEIAAMAATMACFQNGTLRRLPGRGTATVVGGHGDYSILLTATVPGDVALKTIRGAFERAMTRASRIAASQSPAMLAKPLTEVPDFQAQREQLDTQRYRDLLEGNWLMQIGYACTRTGLSPADLRDAYERVDVETVAKMLDDACVPEARRSARITFKPSK